MGKKKKRKKKQPVDHLSMGELSIGELIRDIDAMVAGQRGHKAMGLAKLLIKHPEFKKEHTKQVIAAYGARIREMLEKGQPENVKPLADYLLQKFPDKNEGFFRDLLIRCDLAAGTDFLLPEYGKTKDITTHIDRFIRMELQQLEIPARHPCLPAQHPLKQQAGLILDALNEVESANGAGTQYQQMLKTIGRRSPFAGWRLFIQALAAYYQFDDMSARNCLDKVSEFPPLAAGAEILSDLLAAREPKSEAGKKILMHSSDSGLYSDLKEIQSLFDQGRYREWDQRMYRLLAFDELKSKPGLRKEIAAVALIHGMQPGQSPYSNCLCCNPPKWLERLPDKTEITLYTLAKTGRIDCCDWEELLDQKQSTFSKLEKALIYQEMARAELESDDDGMPLLLPSHLRSLFERVRMNTQQAEEYFSKSVTACPLRETYRQWYDVKQKETLLSEKILEKWHRDFPDDPAPLLHLVDSYRTRNVFQKAMSSFQSLEKIASGMKELDERRSYLLLDNATRHIANGRMDKALDLLDRIPEKADGYVLAIQTVYRWHIASQAGELPATYNEAIRKLQQPLSLAGIVDLLKKKKIRIDQRLLEIAPLSCIAPEILVHNFCRLVHIRDPLWQPDISRLIFDEVRAAFQATPVPSADLLDCARLLSNTKNQDPLMWIIIAKGISHEDEWLAEFLVRRALQLLQCFPFFTTRYQAFRKRINACLAVAFKTAKERGSIETIALIDQVAGMISEKYIRMEAEALTDQKVKQVIALEAETLTMPQTRSGKARKPAKNRHKKKNNKKLPAKKAQVQLELFS